MNSYFSVKACLNIFIIGAVCMLAWIPICAEAEAEVLTEPDRLALIEELNKIRKISEDRVSGLYSKAIQDYRAAIQSDTATMELYLKCIEKVNFKDRNRKDSDFRDWKKKNKEKIKSSSMKMALRHQISWLLLSIEAAQLEGDLSEMGNRAIKHLDQIFDHASELKDHRNILSMNALGSVFARGYNLEIKVENWPRSALDVASIYEKVVMPPLREGESIEALRSAWNKRIIHEAKVIEAWAPKQEKKIGTKKALRPPEFELFLTERKPDILWQMEVDCFEAGDERASALRMIRHLELYIKHKKAPSWIEKFEELIGSLEVTNEELEDEDIDFEE